MLEQTNHHALMVLTTVLLALGTLAGCSNTMPDTASAIEAEPEVFNYTLVSASVTTASCQVLSMTHIEHVRFSHNTSDFYVGSSDADGVALPLTLAAGQWWVISSNSNWPSSAHRDNYRLKIEPLLAQAWPVKPKRVRLLLTGQQNNTVLTQLRHKLRQKWPKVPIEWSVANVGQLMQLKSLFRADRVGYHGALDELPNGHRVADFYSVTQTELQTVVDGSFARNQIELKVDQLDVFLTWLERQPAQQKTFAGTVGMSQRAQFCHLFRQPEKGDSLPPLLNKRKAPIRLKLDDNR